ncbi:MAG: MFS transporter [Candidatus Glassbacteria bacterium]|nr:MFS transporter [Candidatus Glassbacteria bacterium]
MTPREFPARLTQAQKVRAQRRFLWFASTNALSYAALAESVLVLFALQLGARDWHIGLLTGYVYLALVFVLAGKVLVSRWGAARTHSACWFTRNLVAGSFILAPWLYVNVSPAVGLGWLMVAALVFFIFRAMGLSAENVLINDITGPEDRGRFIARWQGFAYIAMLGMLIGVSFWLGETPEFWRFQWLIGIGCVLGVAASVFMFNVPESAGPRDSSREPLVNTLQTLYGKRRLKRLLVMFAVVYAGIQLLVPFQILAVKNGYGTGDRTTIIFVVLQMLGMVAGSWPVSLMIDRTGPRPILILNVFGLAVLAALWAVSPDTAQLAYTGLLFFLVGWTMVGVFIAGGHYFQNVVPGGSILNMNLLTLVVQGASAGLAGTVIGGGLLELLREFGLGGMEVYRTYFTAVVAVFGLAVVSVIRLQPLTERKVREVVGMMFSPRDWRALVNLQRLSDAPERDESLELIEELGTLGSELGETALVEYLDSPLITVRTAALEALDRIEFGDSTTFRLIEEVKDGEFSTAFMAAEILGRHRVAQAASALREALYSNDFFLEGKAMVALAQLGDTASYGRIAEIFATTYNPRLVIHGARALYYMGEAANVAPLLRKLDPRALPAEHDQIMASAMGLLGWGGQFFRLMTLYNRGAVLGNDMLADDVEKRLLARGEEVDAATREAIKNALEEAAAQTLSGEPAALLALLRLAESKSEHGKLVKNLLEDDAARVRAATQRLRFSLTMLGVYLLVG